MLEIKKKNSNTQKDWKMAFPEQIINLKFIEVPDCWNDK